MTRSPADEPPLDRSRDHVLEELALARALALAAEAEIRERVEALAARRAVLMEMREAFNREATARRHARGEIYTAARVAALNALGPDREELEREAATLYGRHASAVDVLKTHARVHYVNVLMGSRLNLAHFPPDIVAAARTMHAAEEEFASAWVAAIGDPMFTQEIRALQREALRLLRTATRPMFLATQPDTPALDDAHAAVLGKAWAKLDELAATLGVEPLSGFIAVPGEDEAGGVAPARILASVEALAAALRQPGCKLPGKKATLASLDGVAGALRTLVAADARAWFDIDV